MSQHLAQQVALQSLVATPPAPANPQQASQLAAVPHPPAEIVPTEEKGVRSKQESSSQERAARLEALMEVYTSAKRLLRLQMIGADRDALAEAHGAARTIYRDVTARFGKLNDPTNRDLFERTNPVGSFLRTLEVKAPQVKSKSKGHPPRWVCVPLLSDAAPLLVRPNEQATSADSPEAALLITLNEFGRPSLRRIAELLGTNQEAARTQLGELVFDTPEGEIQTAEEYLSGDIRAKLAAAEAEINRGRDEFRTNVRRLEDVLPTALTAAEIIVRLGSTWVPEEVIQDFVRHLLGQGYTGHITYNRILTKWIVEPARRAVRTSFAATTRWGTTRMHALALIDDALNLRVPQVRDNHSTPEDPIYVTNEVETAAAVAKLEEIKAEFSAWVWSDSARAGVLVERYNERFNRARRRRFDGRHLTFPGMSRRVTPYAHQRDGVWRILQSRATLLAHAVGAGKTLVALASAMELKRLGLARKSLAIVPKKAVAQWIKQAAALYPGMKLFVATEGDFAPSRREETLSKIATGDWGLVLITHDQCTQIPVSDQTADYFVYSERKRAEAEISRLQANGAQGNKREIASLRQHVTRLEKDLADARAARAATKFTCGIVWDELGIDALFIDEFQAYKNLAVPTRLSGIAGIGTNDAQRAADMHVKIEQMLRIGGRVVALTGTPLTNSLTEAFILQYYLQRETLERAGVGRLDAWIGNFAEVLSATELTPEGTGFRQKARLRQFQNLPELSIMLACVMDVQRASDLNLPTVPKRVGGKTIIIPVEASDNLRRIMRSLADRADAIRNRGKVRANSPAQTNVKNTSSPSAPAQAALLQPQSRDNMLAITGDGRRAALDPRLLEPLLAEDASCKLNSVAERVLALYHRTHHNRGAQLVFIDQSTPKLHSQTDWSKYPASATTNLPDGLYHELRRKLVAGGIRPEEVRFIHDARCVSERSQLEDDVNEGHVRVLIGTTARMGEAINVQRRLIALHHVDPPWRPADIEQREGRILRQGNLYPKVFLFQYVTKCSFDGYIFQLLEAKARYIDELMRGEVTQRTAEDIGEMVLTASQAKAVAAGDPRVRQRIEGELHLLKLERLRAAFESLQDRLSDEARSLPAKITTAAEEVASIGDALRQRQPAPEDGFKIELADSIGGRKGSDDGGGTPLDVYTERRNAGRILEHLSDDALDVARTQSAARTFWVGRYRGFLVGVHAAPAGIGSSNRLPYSEGSSREWCDTLFGSRREVHLIPEETARAASHAAQGSAQTNVQSLRPLRLCASVSDSYLGTIQAIDYQLRHLDERYESSLAALAATEKRLESVTAQRAAGWQHAARYTYFRERFASLTSELASEGHELDDATTQAFAPLEARHFAGGQLPGDAELAAAVAQAMSERDGAMLHDYDAVTNEGADAITGLESEPIIFAEEEDVAGDTDREEDALAVETNAADETDTNATEELIAPHVDGAIRTQPGLLVATESVEPAEAARHSDAALSTESTIHEVNIASIRTQLPLLNVGANVSSRSHRRHGRERERSTTQLALF